MGVLFMVKKPRKGQGRWRPVTVIYHTFLYIFLLEMAFIILTPFLIKILAAFMSPSDLLDTTVRIIPRNWSLYYWEEAWKALKIQSAGVFTFVISAAVGILQMLVSSFIGYGLARFRFRGRNLAFAAVIVMMLIPPQTYSVAEFLHFRFFGVGDIQVNLINTGVPMVLLAMFGMGLKQGLYIYMMREFYMGLPKDMENAAYIDGASAMKTYFLVAMPNARIIMTMVFLFSFCWQWTDTSQSSVLFTEPTLLASRPGDLALRAGGASLDVIGTAIGRNAMAILIIIPLLFLFMLCQKSLVRSMSRSGQAN